MALLSRFWSYISPRKADATRNATPQTAPPARKRGRPPGRPKSTTKDAVRQTKSMSPIERVDCWRAQSTLSGSSKAGRKRKTPMTPSAASGHQRKALKVEQKDSEDDYDEDESAMRIQLGQEEYSADEADSEDVELEAASEDDVEHDDDEVEAESNIHLDRSSTPADHESYYDEDVQGDTSLLVSEHDYTSPHRKKIISPAQEAFDRGISEQELRDQGWDDDHIALVQKIAMRGYEPLLPNYYKFEWPWMPDALFAADDDAILCPQRTKFSRGSKALECLFELGGRVRDRLILPNTNITPELQTKKMMKEYMKWATTDSGLDPQTAIPLLTLQCRPSSTPAAELQERARAKLAALAARYRAAFAIKPSIESSPSSISTKSQILSHPLPTLYAIIASGTLVALVAYNPADAEPDVKSIAFFQMADKAYDVWNALALAIVVCHMRNVQVRVAEETGLGPNRLPQPRPIKPHVIDLRRPMHVSSEAPAPLLVLKASPLSVDRDFHIRALGVEEEGFAPLDAARSQEAESLDVWLVVKSTLSSAGNAVGQSKRCRTAAQVRWRWCSHFVNCSALMLGGRRSVSVVSGNIGVEL
ncbi:uncharacterized protein LTR77_008940 [Saxophila tyrrhenica]|uniref:Uncharacterized protein n=1 Tax=Saxophila tyrrhenica TaxID=1690608 RepID=A0AAV9P2H0_9PEZI|nr:hypothetical protein LTR77_008940 [Saxophila tyrrhenica]